MELTATNQKDKKYRLKSKAMMISEHLIDVELTIDGYLMLSKDGGKTYDTEFDKDDAKQLAHIFPKNVFIVEESKERKDR